MKDPGILVSHVAVNRHDINSVTTKAISVQAAISSSSTANLVHERVVIGAGDAGPGIHPISLPISQPHGIFVARPMTTLNIS